MSACALGMMHDRVVATDAWEHWPGPDEPIVFVVGAGFSRAVSDRMPLTDQLGENALAALRSLLPPRLALERLPRGLNFEAWLSQLAGDQPYLPDAENAENRAAFQRFSEAIADIIGTRVQEALANPYPEWLLSHLSVPPTITLATVITFNYDTLIECMVATPTGILGNPDLQGQLWQGVGWTELTGGLPPPGDSGLPAEKVDTLRLLKLHGSLNWYWRAGDSSGISVVRRNLPEWSRRPSAIRRRAAAPRRARSNTVRRATYSDKV